MAEQQVRPKFPVVFDHIFKTAGTSVYKYFLDCFGSEFVPEKIAGVCYTDLLPHVALNKVVCGHLNTRPGDDILISCNYTVTILRDPIERLISQYNFMRADFNASSKYHDEAKTLPPEQYFFGRNELSDRFHNTYLKHFTFAHRNYSATLSSKDAILHAREVMDQYAVVGIVPKIEEFLALIAVDLGVSPPGSAPKENVNENRRNFDKFSSSLIDRLREVNAADFELYEYAASLYLKKIHERLQTNQNSKPLLPQLNASPSSHILDEPHYRVYSKEIELVSAKVFQEGSLEGQITIGRKTYLILTLRVEKLLGTANPVFQISDSSGRNLYQSSLGDHGYRVTQIGGGVFCLMVVFSNHLGVGKYYIDFGLYESMPFESKCWYWQDKVSSFHSVVSKIDDTFKGVVALTPEILFYPIEERNKHLEVCQIPQMPSSKHYGSDVVRLSSLFPLEQVFPFDHPSIRTQVGALKTDGIYTLSGASAGYLVFGPYITLLPGHYRIDFDIVNIITESSNEILVDVCDSNRIVLSAPRPLQFKADIAQSIDFYLDRLGENIEIRLHVNFNANTVFRKYHLVHLI